MNDRLVPRGWRRCLTVIAFVMSATWLIGTETTLAQAVESPRFALLIGVGKYPGLSAGEQLDGSVNDVAAMQQLLTERFAFPASQVTTLVDEQATATGIREAIANLAKQIQRLPSDAGTAQIVVHFSGHGSQVPDQPDGPDHDEDDGLDETWVPYDAQSQGGDQDIRDDELNDFATVLCEAGNARLLIVADGCHSGTGARGATKVRQLKRDVKPIASVNAAPLTRKRLPTGAVFLSACRAKEVEPEFRDGDKTYGLLTRFLVETLSNERTVSTMTYDRLQRAIVDRYQRDRRVMQPPTPQLEGDLSVLTKATVLGFGPDVDRPAYYSLTMGGNQSVEMKAGKFHDVTLGSLYEVYSLADEIGRGESLAWLEVTEVTATTSKGTLFRWNGDERVSVNVSAENQNAWAVFRKRGPGEESVRLRIERVVDQSSEMEVLSREDASLPPAIAVALSTATRKGEASWLNCTSATNEPCDLVLRFENGFAALFPATGVPETTDAPDPNSSVPFSLRGGWGPINLAEEDSALAIVDYLRRVTRARNLISLAQTAANATAASDVELTLLKLEYDKANDQVISQKPWPMDQDAAEIVTNARTVHDTDYYSIRVRNRNENGKPIYVTVLEISPDMGIEVVVPYEEPPIKLEQGEHRDGDPFVTHGVHGQWHAVVLATYEPSDFSFVAQPNLVKSRGGATEHEEGSLHSLLDQSTGFQPPRSRGRLKRPKSTDNTWSAGVLSWQAAP